ncbi:hypothetical protein CGCF415_v010205 [Colletotrichum fructicola]|uniref:Uncharacterized protein n=2 Tax=Colletotrichum fructicola (strain Nara gc5) TaxID=1213859 RepID=A0A7J6J6C8_COLFN|nr:hypothetical protein CFRS1_v006412 [Colletotrichum fructicola]KAF4485086.1 hypothetical protein CGGC5_v007275 [Colletotrichum fructicola Nara gc5]KAF4881969.1 hypothetical protein CGCFRS4_v015025 [Colletotrichum fructicola]KAF4900248.1 hypothetical protein CGCF415_v010205 [Colletotrichum fructicola]KAF4933020.1 hypothetical protein CGCF245_v010073 [Colletotrichum fructicola]
MSPSVTTGYPHVQRSSASLPSAQAHNALPHRYAPAPGGMPTADPNPYQARAATNTSPNEINYGYTVSDEDWNDIMEMEPPHGEGVLLSPEVPRAWTGEPMYQDTNGPQLMILDNVVYHIDHNLPRNEPSQADRAGRPRSPNATQPAQFTTPGVPHEVDEDADADAETDADAFADADADADAVAGADADDLQAEQGLPSPIAPTTLSEVGSDYFDV